MSSMASYTFNKVWKKKKTHLCVKEYFKGYKVQGSRERGPILINVEIKMIKNKLKNKLF